jgi:hypothetical protein
MDKSVVLRRADDDVCNLFTLFNFKRMSHFDFFQKVLLFTSFLYGLSAMLVADEPLSKDTLLTKATEAWKLSKTQLDGMCIIWKETRREILTKAGEKKEEHNVYRNTLNVRGENISFQTVSVDSSSYGSNFVVQNKDYAFGVGQVSKDRPYELTYYGAADSEPIQSIKDNDIAVLTTPWAVFSVPMWEIVNDPSFMIKELKYQEGKKGNQVFLMFSLNSDRDGGIGEIKAGEVLFDINRYWAIQEYHLDLKHKNVNDTFQVEVEALYDSSSEIPLLTHQEYTLFIQVGKITWSTDVESREKSTLTEKDFRLTAFGIPEPDANQNRANARFIMLIIALILIVITIWVQFSKRKSNS